MIHQNSCTSSGFLLIKMLSIWRSNWISLTKNLWMSWSISISRCIGQNCKLDKRRFFNFVKFDFRWHLWLRSLFLHLLPSTELSISIVRILSFLNKFSNSDWFLRILSSLFFLSVCIIIYILNIITRRRFCQDRFIWSVGLKWHWFCNK